MNPLKPEIPPISETERTPLIDALLEFIAWQNARIDYLEQEILKLKGETTKPDIKPSKMDKNNPADNDDDSNKKEDKPKPGPKRKKTETLRVDVTLEVEPDNIPIGSVFKGYREVVIQDLVIQSVNTCYKLAQYQTPDGNYGNFSLPAGSDITN